MSVSICQIQYSDDIVGAFDPAFIKYDCRHNPELEKREIAHMLRFYDEGKWKHLGATHFGLVSPKFSSKAGISGKTFIDWIDANPGYDVYFINPFPQLSYWHFNVWSQGEFWHPELTNLANALFTAAGHPIQVELLPRNAASSLSYSNYWVGNERFWLIFMAFVHQLVTAVDELSASDKKKLFALAPHYTAATYFPFVFERLFSTFLVTQKNIASLSYPYGRDEILSRCENEMERFVVREWAEIIDEWDSSGCDNAEYRKLFANLHGMIQLYQSVALRVGDTNSKIGISQILGKLMRTFGLIP